MNDTAPDSPATPTQHRRHLPLVWLIPLAAAAIAAWLGWHTLENRGPMITIRFDTADGLAAGRTHVTHKAVDLGTVESINLSRDMRSVLVHVRMTRDAADVLTDHARFWVVRPRLTPGSISGLETIVSGAYIEIDPGAPGGTSQRSFQGLSQPPAVRSDEPGSTFEFRAERAGSLAQGSPVFLHDMQVGEVLSSRLDGDHVALTAFVHAPFDQRVHAQTKFWNASGVTFGMSGGGLSVQLESIQAVLQGGLAFDDTPADMSSPVPPGTVFQIYRSAAEARAAAAGPDDLRFVTYLQGNVGALSTGAPVLLYGHQVGVVTGVKLEYAPDSKSFRVPTTFSLDRSQVAVVGGQAVEPLTVARELLARGLRVQAETISYLTGQQGLAFVFGGPPTPLTLQDGAIVIPGEAGGLDAILSQAGSLMNKLGAVPIDQISDRLQHILQSTDTLVSSPELRHTLVSLQGTLASLQSLLSRTDAGLAPVLQRMPQIADDLQRTTSGAAKLVNGTYGANSDFQRQMQRLLDQATEAARTVRELADFLDRHPEALLRGRTGEVSQR